MSPAKDEYADHELTKVFGGSITVEPSEKHPGMTSAWNREKPVPCHICLGDPDKQPDCAMCSGRGEVYEIPYVDDPWTEVAPNLYVGGLATNQTKGHADVDCTSGNFDFVVSLAHPEEHNGKGRITNLTLHAMADGPFKGDNIKDVEAASDMVVSRLAEGQKVLVRCMAGINRSSLVAALAMIKQGLTADEAIEKIRAERSPYCLFNPAYVEHLHKRSAEIHGEV